MKKIFILCLCIFISAKLSDIVLDYQKLKKGEIIIQNADPIAVTIALEKYAIISKLNSEFDIILKNGFTNSSNIGLQQYKWIYSEWSMCSALCNKGISTRNIRCENTKTNEIVSDLYCTSPKEELLKECNTQYCPQSCKDIKMQNSDSMDGIYQIFPNGNMIYSYCDMSTENGGWTLVMKFGNDNILHYFSPYWTDDKILNDNQNPTETKSMKSKTFLQVQGTEGRLTKGNEHIIFELGGQKTFQTLFKENAQTLKVNKWNQNVISKYIGYAQPNLGEKYLATNQFWGSGYYNQGYSFYYYYGSGGARLGYTYAYRGGRIGCTGYDGYTHFGGSRGIGLYAHRGPCGYYAETSASTSDPDSLWIR